MSVVSKKTKLLKFLLKEIPGLVPFAGNIWKDAIDEFTEDDVDRTLKRIEGFRQQDMETQKEILLGILLLKRDFNSIFGLLAHIRRKEERERLLAWVKEMDWGNARFLIELQKTSKAFALNHNFSKELRDGYLDMLEDLASKEEISQGVFHYVDALVAFPDGYEEYASIIENPILEKPSVPVLIEKLEFSIRDEEFHFVGGKRRPIPFLPTINGFINSLDSETYLPNSVGDEPSDDFYGAYYWVKPNGLRTVAKGIGVLDPLEVIHGTAIWWRWDQHSSLIGIRPFADDSEEIRRSVSQRTIERYKGAIREYSKRKA
jgi:hypothetical protein